MSGEDFQVICSQGTEGPHLTWILGLEKKTRYVKFALVGL